MKIVQYTGPYVIMVAIYHYFERRIDNFLNFHMSNSPFFEISASFKGPHKNTAV